MIVKDLFVKEIDRDINPVISVDGDNTKKAFKELEEYVVTSELQDKFEEFFVKFRDTMDKPDISTAVWISGFYGSGKSHLLEVISYLLSNPVVDGVSAVDIILPQIEDNLVAAAIQQAANIKTETILFDLSKKHADVKDETVIKRTFSQEFYNHLGYIGKSRKLALLQQFLNSKNLLDVFYKDYEEINDDEFDASLAASGFLNDEIAETLQKTLGWSETAAMKWVEDEKDNDYSVEDLVDEINAYVNQKEKEYGKFHLVFLLDEVGQFLGDDSSLMLNLQAIVETIKNKCKGRVWVIVTGQESVDKYTKVKGNDFSKIQGRFDVELKLASSNIDEIIQKRVLRKTDNAAEILKAGYAGRKVELDGLYNFENKSGGIFTGTYDNEEDYVNNYPVVPYQYRIVQDAISQIRQKGQTGASASGGERSLLLAFQNAVTQVMDQGLDTLVPLYEFYPRITKLLHSDILRVFERVQADIKKHNGLESIDLNTIQTLYLIRYINDIKPTTDSVARLMVDHVGENLLEFKKKVQDSLNRLDSKGYIARLGDIYQFLTNEEQDIDKEIRATVVEDSQVNRKIAEYLFEEIYKEGKIKHGDRILPFVRKVDDTNYSSPVNCFMSLNVLTAENMGTMTMQDIIFRTGIEGKNAEAFVLLSQKYPYYRHFEDVVRFENYWNLKMGAGSLPRNVKQIIEHRKDDNDRLLDQAVSELRKAVNEGEFFVAGSQKTYNAGQASDRMHALMEDLVMYVYRNIDCIDTHAKGPDDIKKILEKSIVEQTLAGEEPDNQKASSFFMDLVNVAEKGKDSLGYFVKLFSEPPYGWSELDTRLIAAQLALEDKIYFVQRQDEKDRKDPFVVKTLCSNKKSDWEAIRLLRKDPVDANVIHKSYVILKGLENSISLQENEQSLNRYAQEYLNKRLSEAKQLYQRKYGQGKDYPGEEILKEVIALYEEILKKKPFNGQLLKEIIRKEIELQDAVDDLSDITEFFRTQSIIYGKALDWVKIMDDDEFYFTGNSKVSELLKKMMQILNNKDDPYGDIPKLGEYQEDLEKLYDLTADELKEKLEEKIHADIDEFNSLPLVSVQAQDKRSGYVYQFEHYLKKLNEFKRLKDIDAFQTQTDRDKNRFIQMLLQLDEEHVHSNNENDKASSDLIPCGKKSGPVKKNRKVLTRYQLCQHRVIRSEEEAEAYIDSIRKEIFDSLREFREVEVK